MRPRGGYEAVEFVYVERAAAVVGHGLNAILLGLALTVVVVMVVTVAVLAMLGVATVVVMVVVLMLMLVVMEMMVLVSLVFLLGGDGAFNLAYPCGRCGDLLVVEQAGVDYAVKVNVGIVGVDDAGLGLYGTYNLTYVVSLFGSDLRNLVEQNDIAELDLLYDKVLDILVADALTGESGTAFKLRCHAQGVDHRYDAVESRHDAVSGLSRVKLRYGADGAGYWLGLADAARLDDDIVELARIGEVGNLLHEIHFQCAANAAV